mgnify:CR=1 FL=1
MRAARNEQDDHAFAGGARLQRLPAPRTAADADVAARGRSEATTSACVALTADNPSGTAQSGIPNKHASPSTR